MASHPYILLRGREHGNEFFTTNTGKNQTVGTNGAVWYDVIGYADTVCEAQRKLTGKCYDPKCEDHRP